jgi:tetratricopeptide (TPR) repeat protein
MFETGRVGEASKAVEAVLDIDPGNERALRYLIELHEARGDYDTALVYAKRLVATDPSNDEFLYRLAWVHEKADQRADAIVVLRRVIEINPDNGPALNFLGYTYAERGENLEEAEQLVKRALLLHPNDGFFIDSLGWVYFQQGDYSRAVDHLEKAASLSGNDPVISEHLGDAYLKVGRTDAAVRVYRDCEARTDDNAQRTRVQRKLTELESRAGNMLPSL